MNNELERILGEVADGASRQAGAIPVGALRGRGVRRRRTRQAGYSVVGVAAAFALAFGAAQLLPDGEPVGPAGTPTADSPTADATLPLGACGSDVSNLPAIDGAVWLELSSTDVRTPVGAPAAVAVTVQNFGAEPLDLTRGEGPYLFVARDDVVVGFSWPPGPGEAEVGAGDEYTRDDVGPFVLCEQGELRPSGSTSDRTPLPVGEYTIHTALTLRSEAERAESGLGWAFDLLGRDGTLTVTDQGMDPDTEAPAVELEAVEVSLPACSEPIEGFEFPDGAHSGADLPLEITVGHTGEDENGDREFFGEGYGDQLQVSFDYLNEVEDWGEARELDAGVVIARDGVVVGEMSWPRWSEVRWNGWPLGESRSIGPVGDWVDCASGEHGQVPKGDYEILGWRTVEVTRPDGSTGVLTVAYPATPFTAYDFEDPDNPGPTPTP